MMNPLYPGKVLIPLQKARETKIIRTDSSAPAAAAASSTFSGHNNNNNNDDDEEEKKKVNTNNNDDWIFPSFCQNPDTPSPTILWNIFHFAFVSPITQFELRQWHRGSNIYCCGLGPPQGKFAVSGEEDARLIRERRMDDDDRWDFFRPSLVVDLDVQDVTNSKIHQFRMAWTPDDNDEKAGWFGKVFDRSCPDRMATVADFFFTMYETQERSKIHVYKYDEAVKFFVPHDNLRDIVEFLGQTKHIYDDLFQCQLSFIIFVALQMATAAGAAHRSGMLQLVAHNGVDLQTRLFQQCAEATISSSSGKEEIDTTTRRAAKKPKKEILQSQSSSSSSSSSAPLWEDVICNNVGNCQQIIAEFCVPTKDGFLYTYQYTGEQEEEEENQEEDAVLLAADAPPDCSMDWYKHQVASLVMAISCYNDRQQEGGNDNNNHHDNMDNYYSRIVDHLLDFLAPDPTNVVLREYWIPNFYYQEDECLLCFDEVEIELQRIKREGSRKKCDVDFVLAFLTFLRPLAMGWTTAQDVATSTPPPQPQLSRAESAAAAVAEEQGGGGGLFDESESDSETEQQQQQRRRPPSPGQREEENCNGGGNAAAAGGHDNELFSDSSSSEDEGD